MGGLSHLWRKLRDRTSWTVLGEACRFSWSGRSDKEKHSCRQCLQKSPPGDGHENCVFLVHTRARLCVCFSCLITSMAEGQRCSSGSKATSAVYTADLTVRLRVNKLQQQFFCCCCFKISFSFRRCCPKNAKFAGVFLSLCCVACSLSMLNISLKDPKLELLKKKCCMHGSV